MHLNYKLSCVIHAFDTETTIEVKPNDSQEKTLLTVFSRISNTKFQDFSSEVSLRNVQIQIHDTTITAG